MDHSHSTIPLQMGALTPEQITLMLTHLPIDITFVDAGNDVRFYTGGKQRIFERTPDVIGRNVLNCHHPDSVQLVMRILEDFRAGKRDTAEFWIPMKGETAEPRLIQHPLLCRAGCRRKFPGNRRGRPGCDRHSQSGGGTQAAG